MSTAGVSASLAGFAADGAVASALEPSDFSQRDRDGSLLGKLPQSEALPLGPVTRDLVHAPYHNQMQINGGKNDGFVAWGNTGGLTMGHCADTRYNLRPPRVARAVPRMAQLSLAPAR